VPPSVFEEIKLTLKTHKKAKSKKFWQEKKIHVANISHPVAHIDVERLVRMSPELKARLKKLTEIFEMPK
jgi:hypothetical protein